MSRKVIQQAEETGLEDHSMVGDQAKLASNKYEFTVILITVQRRYKVKKTFGQIIELEDHVSEIIAQYEARDPSAKVFKSVKLLFPSRKWCSQSQLGSDKQFLKNIEEMERFLRAVTARQEFWSEYLFDFLMIPGDYVVTLLDEKERYLCQPKSTIYAKNETRHNSYART